MDRRQNMADGFDLMVREEPSSGGNVTGQAATPTRDVMSVRKPEDARGPQEPVQEAPAQPAGGKPEHKHHGGKHHAKDAPKKKSRIRKPLLAAVALIALAAGGYEGYHWWTLGRFEIETDDAYVHVDMTIMAAKVSGYITSVDVTDNQFVREGDIIARIDDGDYRLAVDAAKGKVATQQAAIARIAEQVKAGQASVEQAEAQIAAAQADVDRAELEFDRQQQLAKSNFASKQALDNARADRDRTRANLASAKAGLDSARANVGVLNAQRVEAERSLDEDRTSLARAERDLSFTEIKAPVSGVIGNRAVQVGKLVSVGERLAALVPLDAVYVDANYKETQLGKLKPGQRVDITVDAYPGRVFAGEVASISPASGALFSLLPPENATGNFTKIVQRVPVRIRFSPDTLSDHVLRPGMSVVATVDTRHEDGTQQTAALKASAERR
ncbi:MULTISPECIES: HlyD family secretion protein [unclassified Chelatococcus]|uniref:HlyD family secretion protein n=1 Tax=unclassified Chelatococcus TaxID=2638111 RepID=UPI00224BC668|nr:HlyD family secretion protein [Chelatococcus sp.]MCO5076697.1 HlyD family secretion protein [Chelatococcus sp.]CAH1673862.1 Membrane fusion component of tripartite multidrug resistance system [Hyphomicrobiales bacterium]CAH1673896.1 Membrane fusion component of tripartite multidrug resistance system [Hyphomicrobiales bacterium]